MQSWLERILKQKTKTKTKQRPKATDLLHSNYA